MPQWLHLAETLNGEDVAYTQPSFDKTGAKRRLIPLASMVALIQHLRKSLSHRKKCKQNPDELGQRFDWMLQEKILHTVDNPSDSEFWRIPEVILSATQRKAYGATNTTADLNVAFDD